MKGEPKGGLRMPTYEYRCDACGDQFTCEARMSDPPLARKPGCQAESCRPTKLMSRFYGMIAATGRSPRPPEMPAQPTPAAAAEPEPEPHVCSKYCSLHK